MLRPSELDAVLAAARARAKQRSLRAIGVPQAERSITAPARARGAGSPAKSQVRATQSVQLPSGTGINPWWRYQESSIPGGGRLMVNVGTGNVLLQDDDMNVPHKGIALAFRRTYNSQSVHDVNGDEAGLYTSTLGMYGNGWTNTFDAHVIKTPQGTYVVADVDGAQYEYTQNVAGDMTAGFTGPPGQHASLVWDRGCGLIWTKKSGTAYYFYRDAPTVHCPALSQVGGYAGRLYQIVGRNRNTSLTFSYSWDNRDASATGKVSAISVATESGLTATLSFGDISGHRLLQQITFPGGSTNVQYGYDASGNLTSVTEPSNNAAGTNPVKFFGYQAIGSGYVMQWASSPRWDVCTPGCGNDGGYVYFGYGGSAVPTSTLAYVIHDAYVNPSISDGSSSGPVQPAYSSSYTNFSFEYFTTGTTTPTLRDTDGHATNWIVDSAFRPTQIQECTASVNQACSANAYVTTNQTWDADNNLVSEVDPRGGETDYAYDAMGNTVAVGEPTTTATTAGGPTTFRPTKLFDYDAHDNLIAYCDEKASHAAHGDWTAAGPPTVGWPDSLCASNGSSAHAIFTYPLDAAPPYEQFGQLTNIRSPLGYNRAISYAASSQGGIDSGLPTSVQGDPISQPDGTRTPLQSFVYDSAGNLVCSMADGNDPTTTTVLAYDSLNRLTAIGDPDDASLTNGACHKQPGIAGSAIVTRKTYFDDGSLKSTQTPSEAAANVSTQFTYDLDGNERTEVHHYTGAAATSQKWYDGADRLIEVQQPTDPNDFYQFPWTTRYLYDLTQGGTVTVGTSAPYRAYGGLYKTQEVLPSSTTTPSWAETGSTGNGQGSWQDTAGTGFDGLDRAVVQYRSSSIGMMPVTNTYDSGANAGLLSQTCNANNECQYFSYDERGLKTRNSFSSSSDVQVFTHDEDGRLANAQNAVGSIVDAYDANGRKSTRTQTVGSGTPSILTYDYYADDLRADVFIGGLANMPNVLAYTYRGDGLARRLTLPSNNYFNFSYTGGRRLTTRSDSTGQTPYTISYASPGSTPTSYGLPIAENMPAWQESAMLFNAEGGQVSANSYALNNGAFYPAALLNAVYSTRGELAKELYPSGSVSGFAALLANGTRIPVVRSAGPPATGAYTFDARQGFPTSTRTANTCNDVNRCGLNDDGSVENDTSTQYQYDVVGRQIGQQDYTPVGSQGVWQESAKTYDEQDHLLVDHRPNERLYGGKATGTVDFSLGYVWGPLNHPFRVGSTSVGGLSGPSPTDFRYDDLYWDDDSLLFTVNSAGAIDDIKIGDFADYIPGASIPLTVWERSSDGQIHGCHTASGAGVVQTDTFQRQTLACYAPSSFISPQYKSVNPAMVGRGALLTMPKDDGFSDGYNTIQGVRTFDTQAGVWTTPDADRGIVHDPMSQKPYMWNRNNPYQYSDPSGYSIVPSDAPVSCNMLCRIMNLVDEIRVGASSPTTTPKFRNEFGRVFEKSSDAIRDHLRIEDIKGAVIQARTGRRTVAGNGRAYDHLGEVQDAVNSINNGLRKAQELSKQTWLSQGDRDTLKLAVDYLNQAKTELQQILSRDGAASAIKW